MRKSLDLVMDYAEAMTVVSIIDRHRKAKGNPGQVIQDKLARCRRIKFWNIGSDQVRTIGRILKRGGFPFEVVGKVSLVIYVGTNDTLNVLRGKPSVKDKVPQPLPLRPKHVADSTRKLERKVPYKPAPLMGAALQPGMLDIAIVGEFHSDETLRQSVALAIHLVQAQFMVANTVTPNAPATNKLLNHLRNLQLLYRMGAHPDLDANGVGLLEQCEIAIKG